MRHAFIRFLMVGVVNTVVGYSAILTFQLVLGMPATLANACGYLVGMLLSYALNRRFTFKSQRGHRASMPAFAVVAAACYGINLLVLTLVMTFAPLVPAALAQAVAVAAYTLSFYVASRHLVFHRS